MQNRKLIYSVLIFLLTIAFIFWFIIVSSKNNNLKVVFLDVGQGDAILVSQGSNQILIDGGKSGQLVLEKLGKYIPFWDRKIEVVIMTHPDQDHIGGLADIFKNYEVETVLKTNTKSDSKTFEILGGYIALEKAQVFEAKKGMALSFPDGARIEIIYPPTSVSEESDDTNSSSIVSVLETAKSSFLFTGDLPAVQENEIMQSGWQKEIDVLKLAHHGSKYSSSEEFLNLIKPRDAVISVGKNSYGHPNEDTLQRLIGKNVNIFRTDEIGDIVYLCSGPDLECLMQMK